MIIVQITDTHIMPKGDDWCNLPATQTTQRLNKIIDHINNLSPKPDLIIHTGDVVDTGSTESYIHAKELLDQLNVNYFLTCGNHDNFSNLKKVFSDHHYLVDNSFANYVIEEYDLRIIVLDTHVEGEDFGLFDADWLRDILSISKKDTIIFMHHFPIKTYDNLCDSINLTNHQGLSQILSEHNQVLGIYCGHFHYGVVSLFENKMCCIAPSVAPTHIIENDQCDELNLSTPCYSVHRYFKGRITSSVIPVGDSVKFE